MESLGNIPGAFCFGAPPPTEASERVVRCAESKNPASLQRGLVSLVYREGVPP